MQPPIKLYCYSQRNIVYTPTIKSKGPVNNNPDPTITVQIFYTIYNNLLTIGKKTHEARNLSPPPGPPPGRPAALAPNSPAGGAAAVS
jgi:hypothetical protein